MNILNAYRNLVRESKPGDTAFCHYSGHGGSVKDYSGDEEDGFDETLIPVDFQRSGQIIDDDLFKELVRPMSTGVLMTCLMDCCHSGTVLDLPYRFTADTVQDIRLLARYLMSEPHLIPFEPESWLESLAKVVKYKEEHGNCNVPRRWRRDPTLGEWVRLQRRQFRKRQLNRRNHNMTDERIRKLEAIGFKWGRELPPV